MKPPTGRDLPSSEAAADRHARLAYNPALDGIRGLSVLAVILYHTSLIRGGWIGVEVFFVLSGYLLTSLLILEREGTRRISLKAFWIRRARRLLPALLILAVVTMVYIAVFARTNGYLDARRDLFGLFTYSSNWTTLGADGYWAQFVVPGPLHHAWSLAIEEQFYVVYPLVALLILPASRRMWVVPMLFAATLAWQLSAAFRWHDVNRLYLGTDTRLAGLMCGVLGAVLLHAWPRARLPAWLGIAGLGWLIVAALVLAGDEMSTFRGPFQISTIAAMVVIATIAKLNPLAKVLSVGPLVQMGKLSYGMYLYHWPILLLLGYQRRSTPWLLSIAVLAITVPVSLISYHLIEQPVRRHGVKAFVRRAPIAAFAAVAAVIAAPLVASAAPRPHATVEEIAARTPPTVANTTVPASPVSASPVSVSPASARPASASPTSGSTVAGNSVPASSVPVSSVTPTTAPFAGTVPRPADRPYRILLVGDSVAVSLEPAFDELGAETGVEMFSRGAGACGFDRERQRYSENHWEPEICTGIVRGWRDDVLAYQPDVVFWVYGAWWGWFWEGKYRDQCDPLQAAHTEGLYSAALADLTASGAPIVMLQPANWEKAQDGPSHIPTAMDCLRAGQRAFAEAHPTQVSVFDAKSLMCTGDLCHATVDGKEVRPDGRHFDGLGAEVILLKMFEQVLEPPPGGWPTLPDIVPPS